LERTVVYEMQVAITRAADALGTSALAHDDPEKACGRLARAFWPCPSSLPCSTARCRWRRTVTTSPERPDGHEVEGFGRDVTVMGQERSMTYRVLLLCRNRAQLGGLRTALDGFTKRHV
jgi:hypothetical protein